MQKRLITRLLILAFLAIITVQQGCFDPNCQFCTNATINKCDSCITGYTLSDNFTCTECKISNCKQCDTSNHCKTCVDNFTLKDNVCYQCNIANCLTCTSNHFCSACNQTISYYKPNSNGDACVLCNITRCSSCSADNTCGVCQNGYQLYPYPGSNDTTTAPKCVTCQLYNCLACNNDNYCALCAPGYQVRSDGECFKCAFPCATCNSNYTCATCQTPYYAPTPDPNNQTCVQNTIPNCDVFGYDSSTGTYMCSTCKQYYTYNSTSKACQLQCKSPCLTCSSTDPSSCNSCAKGYYLSGTQCVSCNEKGCSKCTSNTVCTQCQDGFYLFNQQCKKCPSYCSICTSPNSCTKLSDKKGGRAIVVDPGTGSAVLLVCASTCSSCSTTNPQQCLVCRDGYYLSNKACLPCNTICKTCSSTDPNICTSCFTYGQLVNNTCRVCDPNCLSCSHNVTTQCTSCKVGAYLDSTTKTCITACPDNCLYCSSSTTCTQCQSGFTLFYDSDLNSTICSQCISNCRVCAQNQPGNCLQCGDNMYLDSSQQCTNCDDINCQTCTDLGCQQCYDGYHLTDQLTCAEDCISPCATCSATNPSQCTSCIGGYSYSSTTLSCIPTTNCTGPCSVCPLGYSLLNGICVACTKANCQSCDQSNNTICTSCVYGYYLDGTTGECNVCPTSCDDCLNSQSCTECADGYTTTPTSFNGKGGFQCLPCTGNCKTCLGGQDRCVSCIDNYQLKGWKCIKKFRFSFIVILLTNKATFYKNFMKALRDLNKALTGSNTSTIIITLSSLKQGSVIVSGSGDPSQSSASDPTAINSFNSLMNQLASGNSLGGMPIGSSSVNVLGGSIAPSGDSSSNSLGLILGITIPLGLLLVIGLVVLIVMKGKQIKDNKYDVQQKMQHDQDVKQSRQHLDRSLGEPI